MKTNLNSGDEDRLSATLREWVVDAPLPPRFQEQVWNRIARAEASPEGSFWRGLARLVVKSLERPKMAYSYAAVLLAFGIAAGSLTAQMKSNRLESALGHKNLLSIDPYQQAVASR